MKMAFIAITIYIVRLLSKDHFPVDVYFEIKAFESKLHLLKKQIMRKNNIFLCVVSLYLQLVNKQKRQRLLHRSLPLKFKGSISFAKNTLVIWKHLYVQRSIFCNTF